MSTLILLILPRYDMDTARTRHGHSKDLDFTHKKCSTGYDTLSILKYPCIIDEESIDSSTPTKHDISTNLRISR